MAESIQKMELVLSNVLKVGVIISAFLMIMGLSLMAVTEDVSCPNGSIDPVWYFTSPMMVPSKVIFAGFIVLVTTPVLRIIASVLIYIKSGDKIFAAITGTVLIVLLISFTLGVG
jgi:uncharacterized membrane protein